MWLCICVPTSKKHLALGNTCLRFFRELNAQEFTPPWRVAPETPRRARRDTVSLS